MRRTRAAVGRGAHLHSPPWVGCLTTLHPGSTLSAKRVPNTHASAPTWRRSVHSTRPRISPTRRYPDVSRLAVKKTYKLYVGGAFPRSESGRTYESEGHNVSRASRKDARDAVKAARVAGSPPGPA